MVLLWDAPQSENLDYYEIFAIPPDGSMLSQGTVTKGVTTLMFTVDFLQPDTRYCFQVDAVLSSTGDGDFEKQSNKLTQQVCQETGKFIASKVR